MILPPFYKHNRNDESSEGHDPIAEPAMRVDISALRQYVSTIEGKEAAEGICERSFDVIFFGGKSYCKQSRVESISNYTGFTDFVPRGNEKMKKGDGKKDCHITVPTYPVDEDPVSRPLRLAFNAEMLARRFNSPEHCALWLFPYRTIDFDSLNTARPQTSTRQFAFLKEVFDATKRPAFVRQTVSRFLVKSGMESEYLAIHWRYSRGDWFNHCREQRMSHHDSKHGQACHLATILIDMPDKIGEILAQYVRSEHTGNVTAIYFAAPPTEMELILKVRKYLRRENINVYTAREMIGFLDKNYGQCPQFIDNKYDLLSLIEQEICSRSKIFLRASGSSWSE